MARKFSLTGLFSILCFLAPTYLLADVDYSKDHSFVKVWLEPPKVAVGQKISMMVMFGTDTYFSEPTQLDLPDIEHVLMLETESSFNGGQNLNGKYFTTLQRQIDIYPDQEGVVRIPAFNVSFGQPETIEDEFESTTVELQTTPMLALVRNPPSMKGLSGYMVSDDVDITDDWQGLKETEYAVGDVLQRQIVIEAADMASMNMPQIQPIVPKGVSVTLAEPQLSTKNGRNGQSATLSQNLSYAIEKPGQYQLGDEVLSWWDPDKAERVDHTFKAEQINAGGIPWHTITQAGLVALILVLLVWRLKHYLKHRDATELAIKKKLHSSDAGDRLASLYAYADHHQPRTAEPAQLRVLLPQSEPVIEKTLSGRYSSSPAPSHPSHAESRSLFKRLKSRLK